MYTIYHFVPTMIICKAILTLLIFQQKLHELSRESVSEHSQTQARERRLLLAGLVWNPAATETSVSSDLA